MTADGIPYLKPEIQLLYKLGRDYRKKDYADFVKTVPYLNKENIRWLWQSLKMQYPEGHKCITYLEDLF